MTDIEKKSYEAFPDDGRVNSGLFNQQQGERRQGYIKCAKEYESLPKVRGFVTRDMDGGLNFFISRESNSFGDLNHYDEPVEVEFLVRRV